MSYRNPGPPTTWYGATQVIAVGTSSSAISNATDADTRLLRLATTTDAHVKIGDSPTATTSDPILPAGAIDYVIVEGSTKVAAIQVSTGGSLSVTEASR